MTNEEIAQVCHEANTAYCLVIGDLSQKHWGEAEQWQRDSAIAGVKFAINNPQAPPSAQHDAWLSDKVKDGWVWGVIKDPINKTHPCMVPYGRLPLEQRLKDILFKAVVSALTGGSQ